ncbi:cyclic AMP-dependent transcription factor ATF-2 [Fopius arisanus]|uniref:ATF2_0 protein n=1 Tax=Fopius arisanus TaxID=64838 RepID=A0A0C9R5E7_9HYME|nr:PREDICTED: cyclic AMP-dependent transcription factor ATF-2 [Fopius arisanus]XP_011308094.1 PREDICTED: cyclic AMP-dependent transcription factor ATF-2 [Fopius arisanus]XP_011308095.1 PREDICTED: cyclic AMP-dependent transcription factor ATF-2 [Fopius arisanus]XP_011308096.1 PREDICTED: cyclic AMP-dependent transcription factor ATF-2 [Fopius arisanus]
MGESEKPFACSSPGCNMSFTNEDHLTVHKKKHDMILNFGTNKTGVFVADQTPTPTRFIRNCEEMGLFQDLQNVNPFDETFRRAVESGKLGSLPESEMVQSDDTLHTPQVFPHIENDQSSGSRKLSSDTPDDPCELQKNIVDTTTITKTTETVVIEEADTSVTSVLTTASNSLSINREELQLILKMDDGKLMPLSAIPACGSNSVSGITTQPVEPQTIVIKTDSPVKCPQTAESKKERLSLAKMKLKQVLIKNEFSAEQNPNLEESTNFTPKAQKEKPQDPHKKQDILARNRASSMRARAKRKQWIEQLEKSMQNVNELNTVLQLEIKSLRSEVAKLKTLLLAHKDCPVTKAMDKDIILEAQMVSVPHFLEVPPSDLSTPVFSEKRKSSNDCPKSAKRRPSVLHQKQSILLPKFEDKNVPICVTKLVHGPSQPLKIVELDKRANKSILILQNSSLRRAQCLNSRQIVQVDQRFQLMNVASKSTGA